MQWLDPGISGQGAGATAYNPEAAGATSDVRTLDPTRNTTQPVYNPDGTVTVRVSPEAYRRYAGEWTGQARRRRTVKDLVDGGAPAAPSAVEAP